MSRGDNRPWQAAKRLEAHTGRLGAYTAPIEARAQAITPHIQATEIWARLGGSVTLFVCFAWKTEAVHTAGARLFAQGLTEPDFPFFEPL